MHYIVKGKEPLDKSIFDYVKRSSSSVKSNSSKVISFSQGVHPRSNSSNAKVIERSPAVHEQFTPNEIQMIKEMLKNWQEKQGEAPEGVEQPVHERIKNLPDNKKTRKTIVIDNEIGKQLDEFCKVEKVNKSDVLHLALKDFLNQFKK